MWNQQIHHFWGYVAAVETHWCIITTLYNMTRSSHFIFLAS